MAAECAEKERLEVERAEEERRRKEEKEEERRLKEEEVSSSLTVHTVLCVSMLEVAT